jgi:hypothetical protein
MCLGVVCYEVTGDFEEAYCPEDGERADYLEMLLPMYQTTRRNVSEDINLRTILRVIHYAEWCFQN